MASSSQSNISRPIARNDLEQQEKIVLSNRDRDLLLETLENPPPLKGNLKTAIDQYQQKYRHQ